MAMSLRSRKELLMGIGFLSPNILGFLAFTVVPLVLSLVLAFTNWDLTRHNIFKNEPLEFVGLSHFIYMFGHPRFWQSFWNTLFFMMGIPFGIAGSLALAMLLSRDLRGGSPRHGFIIFFTSAFISILMLAALLLMHWAGVGISSMVLMFAVVSCTVILLGTSGGSTVYRTMFYLPSFTSGVAIFLLWMKMYTRSGPMSQALRHPLDGLSAAINSTPPILLQIVTWLGLAAVAAAMIIGIRQRRYSGPKKMLIGLSAMLIFWALLSIISFIPTEGAGSAAQGQAGSSLLSPVIAVNQLIVATIVRGGYWFFMAGAVAVFVWTLSKIAWLRREGDLAPLGVVFALGLASVPWLTTIIVSLVHELAPYLGLSDTTGWIPRIDSSSDVVALLPWLPMIPAVLLPAIFLPKLFQKSEFPCAPGEGTGTGIMFGAVMMVAQFVLIGIALACFGWWARGPQLGTDVAQIPLDELLAIAPPDWLDQAAWAKPSLMIMGLWAGIGSNNMLLYLAGLSNVPPELYEAADIDGASKGQRFWHVTWPQLAPTTFFIVVMSVIGGLQGGFEMARTMTGGGPDGATTTLAYYIYTQGFEMGRLGYASAVAWTLFAFVFTVTMFNWRFGNRYVNE